MKLVFVIAVSLAAMQMAYAAPPAQESTKKGVGSPVDSVPQAQDLTEGAKPDFAQISWNLGATGAAGWTWSIPHQTTEGATQIYITRVAKGSPADGVLKAGDVLLGAAGNTFTHNARDEFALALTEAETPEKQGRLVLNVWNAGQTREATVPVKVVGRYSDTTPFDCAKSRRIVDGICPGYGALNQAGLPCMLSLSVRLAGIQLMAKHHTREGLDTAVWFLTNQKGPAADQVRAAIQALETAPKPAWVMTSIAEYLK